MATEGHLTIVWYDIPACQQSKGREACKVVGWLVVCHYVPGVWRILRPVWLLLVMSNCLLFRLLFLSLLLMLTRARQSGQCLGSQTVDEYMACIATAASCGIAVCCYYCCCSWLVVAAFPRMLNVFGLGRRCLLWVFVCCCCWSMVVVVVVVDIDVVVIVDRWQ